ncbi:MAG: beta-N-acetylhexosaminidase [Gammaproteobacteria bacterium]
MNTLGPLIIDIAGTTLSPADRRRLTHPMVGGVILFSRNFADYSQIKTLIQEIHQLRQPRLLVAVDHEGGRVQRWRSGFTRIPSMSTLGQLYATNQTLALQSAYRYGRIIAEELTAVGVDLNLAPVLDLDYGYSRVLEGGRSFHADAKTVTTLARAYIQGLRGAGMQAVGKHFPGHGAVVLDTHFELPEDNRPYSELASDILPFQQLVHEKLLGGIMTAHIRYSKLNSQIATISSYWLQTVLRQQLGFEGVIMSDCISMLALAYEGNFPTRLRKALRAGCDLVLLCNNPSAVDQVLECMDAWPDTTSAIKKLYKTTCK